ncbi:phosphoribosyltransferase [Agromyces sp. MMS24-JH15]|uniref:phosphoribosyltransferase n=1 Tax=Agromyces sp. MMS24-JH15 TaxID=3243765 RepID=UPI003748C694
MSWPERFLDRRDAGRRLGERLATRDLLDAVVLGLPRGGVPVADEVAAVIGAPLDVLVVRKLGLPTQPEVAMGAVGEHGTIVRNEDVIRAARVERAAFAEAERRERAEVAARVDRFRGGREPIPLVGRTALVVDDGLATGATARVACRVAREAGARHVVLAVPVGAPDSITAVAEADEVACLSAPPGFMSVGMHYIDFHQVPDDEVAAILRAAHER